MAVCQEGEPRIELGSSPSLGAGDGRPYRQVLESKDRVPEREDISRERERDWESAQRREREPVSRNCSITPHGGEWLEKANGGEERPTKTMRHVERIV